MKPQAAFAAVTALTIALAATGAPAFAARSSYVVDDAQMLSQNAVSQLNQQIGSFNAQTGKEIVVVTVGCAAVAVTTSFVAPAALDAAAVRVVASMVSTKP